MDRDALHRRLKRSIRPIRGPHKKDPSEVLGTAFICGQKGAKSYLLTCWHVIDQINPDVIVHPPLPN